jgi:hypothetical protein
MAERMGTAELTALLRATYPAPEWYFLTGVRSDAGYGSTGATVRTADAIAMNLWPSRGLEIHGFELKVDRRDWLRELKNPEKAEAVARYCDRWWLVVPDPTIVAEGELPVTWGLLAPSPRKVGVRPVVDAPAVEATTPDRGFLAAMLRRALDVKPDDQELRAEFERGAEAARRKRADLDEPKVFNDLRELEGLRRGIARFEEASGIKMHPWAAGDIGKAVQELVRDRAAGEAATNRLANLAREATRIGEELQRRVSDLDAAARMARPT